MTKGSNRRQRIRAHMAEHGVNYMQAATELKRADTQRPADADAATVAGTIRHIAMEEATTGERSPLRAQLGDRLDPASVSFDPTLEGRIALEMRLFDPVKVDYLDLIERNPVAEQGISAKALALSIPQPTATVNRRRPRNVFDAVVPRSEGRVGLDSVAVATLPDWVLAALGYGTERDGHEFVTEVIRTPRTTEAHRVVWGCGQTRHVQSERITAQQYADLLTLLGDDAQMRWFRLEGIERDAVLIVGDRELRIDFRIRH